jgi:hypothetical protein
MFERWSGNVDLIKNKTKTHLKWIKRNGIFENSSAENNHRDFNSKKNNKIKIKPKHTVDYNRSLKLEKKMFWICHMLKICSHVGISGQLIQQLLESVPVLVLLANISETGDMSSIWRLSTIRTFKNQQ